MAGELEMNAVSLAPNSWLEPFFATQVGAPPMPGLYPNLGVNAATPLSFTGRLKVFSFALWLPCGCLAVPV